MCINASARAHNTDFAQGGVRDEEEREDALDGLRQGWAVCCCGDVAMAAMLPLLLCCPVVLGLFLDRR